ncbi:MAG: carbon-phosphorus lyase complex subunit PhnI [Hyphomicrobiaceae bacterium]|nr:carbon-phosphorus lyase complex subunit PhnI [Hyphomicrobiaceae bacterium]
MYVAVKGGEAAIQAAHELLAKRRRGDPAVPELAVAQIREQLSGAVDRVMCEGSLYDPDIAALAIKQARGDLIEAIFLVRAFRTTLPRFGSSLPLDTSRMAIRRRISATYKDLPGGQILGDTFDYTHRLLDPSLLEPAGAESGAHNVAAPPLPLANLEVSSAPKIHSDETPRVSNLLRADGLIEPQQPDPDDPPADLTRAAVGYPASRDLRLQGLARGDEGFLLALGYSTQRGYGRTHPFAGELRRGAVELSFVPEELGFPVVLGEITVTECEMVNQFKGSATEGPQFTRGYGLAFGASERKAMSMALVDRALRAAEFGEDVTAPAQDEEFVLSHADNVQATGFVEHLKLPHYVDFQAELALVRKLRAEHAAQQDVANNPDLATINREAAE